MARKIRPGTESDISRIEWTMVSLRVALEHATEAGAPRLALKIRHALKSADGARRHAQRRADRSAGR